MRLLNYTCVSVFTGVSFLLIGNISFAEFDQGLLKQFRSAVSDMARLRDQATRHVHVSSVSKYSEATLKLMEADFPPEAMRKIRESNKEPLQPSIPAVDYAMLNGQLLESGLLPNGFQFAAAVNNDYFFQVTKKPNSSTYSMQWLTQSGDTIDPRAEEALKSRSELVNTFVLAAWSIFGNSLEELVESDGFRVTSISKVNENDKKLVRIEFERIEEKFRAGGTLTDAYLVCDANRDWAIVKYAANWHDTKGKPVARKEVFQEIPANAGNTPFVSRIDMNTTWLNNPDRVDTSVTTIELVSDELSNDMFRLSGYGLAEPKFENRWLTNWSWLMYLIAGIGCLGAAYYWRRRQSMKSQVA